MFVVRALLLGISNYDEDSLKLPVVPRDLDRMKETLRRLGYAREQIEDNEPQQSLTVAQLRKRLRDFLERSAPEENLLIYFSGHGIEKDGERLLLASDFQIRDAESSLKTSSVSDDDLFSLARKSAANSVLFIIDACRESAELALVLENIGSKGIPSISRSEGTGRADDAPTIAFLLSCSSGQKSYWKKDSDRPSDFTLALCDILSREDELSTLAEVLDATRTSLPRVATDGGPQTPMLGDRLTTGRAGPPEKLIIKQNRAARARQRIETSRACKELTKLSLWKQVESETALKQQVQYLIVQMEDVAFPINERLPLTETGWRYDPPADRAPDRPPERVLKWLDYLLAKSSKPALNAAESSLVLVVPYAYEAILAVAERHLRAGGDPLDPEASEAPVSQMAIAWRLAFKADSTWSSRISLLRSGAPTNKQPKGEPAPARVVAGWLLSQFLHASGALWGSDPATGAGIGGWIGDDFRKLCEDAPFASPDRRPLELLEAWRLTALARSLFCGYEGLQQAAEKEELLSRRQVGGGVNEWSFDETMVAHLLAVAAGMALDLR